MSEPWKRLSWDEWTALSDEDLLEYSRAAQSEVYHSAPPEETLSDIHYDVEEHVGVVNSAYYRRRAEKATQRKLAEEKEWNWKLQLSFPERRTYHG